MAFPDLVILLPGITGSVLANAKGKEVWGISAGVVWRVITSLGDSITGLELAGDDVDDGVTATRLVQDATLVPGLVKIDGYTRISEYLVKQLGLIEGQNFYTFPYDWRRDNRHNAKLLESKAMSWLNHWRASSGNADAKLVLVGHSMGGLISRYFIECLGGWKVTRRLMTLGTPHRGSLNAVGFLANGMKKGIGPLGLDLSPLLRSCPSVYQLLPIFPCVSVDGGAMQRVADAAATGRLPHVDAARAKAARAFHQEIQDAQAINAKEGVYVEQGPKVVPFVGIEQPTAQSALVTGQTVALINSLEGKDYGGDGTVPRMSATPIELGKTPSEIYAAESHGSLQNGDGTLVNLKGVLTREDIDFRKFQRAEDVAMLRLELDDVVLPGEKLKVRVRPSDGNPKIQVTIEPTGGGTPIQAPLRRDAEPRWQSNEFALAPGVWRVIAHGEGAEPVSDLVVVAEA